MPKGAGKKGSVKNATKRPTAKGSAKPMRSTPVNNFANKTPRKQSR